MIFQQFHVTVKALIVWNDKLILMRSKEPDRPNDLEPPGGRVDVGEKIMTTLKRELKEETNLNLDLVKSEVKLFSINQRDEVEYGHDNKTQVLEVYYSVKIKGHMKPDIFAKTESKGLVFIDKNTDLNKYSYTPKGRRGIYRLAQLKLLK